MNKKTICLLFLAFFAFYQSGGQDMYKLSHTPSSSRMHPPVNYFKLNVTALALKNYSVQYERAFSRRASFALGGRFMPSTSIPFRSVISDIAASDDENIKSLINDSRIGNFAITPELKLFFGEGYGQGFYISFFYRYQQFKSNEFPLPFEDETGKTEKINFKGKVTSNTGGVLLGWQKTFGEMFTIDLWFLGPHVGKGTGVFDAATTRVLLPSEQDDIRSSLEELNIPLFTQKVDVNDHGASVTFNGLFGGIRSGILLGIRF